MDRAYRRPYILVDPLSSPLDGMFMIPVELVGRQCGGFKSYVDRVE